ncbi:MAG: hypothetical protein SGPRY_006526 [Prymnesium sp.]
MSVLIEQGRPTNTRLSPLLQLISDTILPYARHTYGAKLCVADALVRRYLPGERQALGQHFDVSAFATAILPLNPGSYVGGLYVQGGASAASRRYVEFEPGDLVTHQFDVMHGLDVMHVVQDSALSLTSWFTSSIWLEGGERYSLVVWFSESEEALALGSAPWVERAARAGSSEAQFILAGFHYRGEFGAPLDLAAAVRWFQMSAEGGSALGMLWMATLYANGEGVPRDESKAIHFWRQAAEQDHASAQHALGCAYRDGFGVVADEATAVFWLRKSANQGMESSKEALSHLGMAKP